MNRDNFLGFSFSPITLDDQEILEGFFKKYPSTLSFYTFASLLGWSKVYRHRWTILGKDTLLMTTYNETLEQTHLLQPIGPFSEETQTALLEAIKHCEYTINIYEVTREFYAAYPEFCSHFLVQEERSLSNYLYKSADLALLEGRRFEKKRNLISQVDKIYHWTVNALDAGCPECPKILTDIGNKNVSEKSLQDELLVLNTILNNYERLHLMGYMIGIDGKPVAFSVVDVLNPTTKVVLFEKADRHFKGLYQLINRETSKAVMDDGYDFINREEDLGIEGLRKAKLSYCPIDIIPSLTLTFNEKPLR